ncbi:hypothetical protein [Clostridium tertium]|uniref:hypothetical protein n=1 Tax=Clostridium tertium TaxID=1559 RepID=UPI001C1E333F|nr:hypothetical protein [Clostridium tertium]MBU6135200.1 hypothetical protein [Clostridium tertium]
MDKKYYVVNHIDFARTLLWLTGQNYMIFDDKRDSTKKVYSFENTNKLQLAMKKLMEVRESLNN